MRQGSTDEILDLFNERRKATTEKNRIHYQHIQQKLEEKKLRVTKSNLLRRKYEQIEQLWNDRKLWFRKPQ